MGALFRLATLLIPFLGRFATMGAILGTLVNVIFGALVAFQSVNLFQSLGKIRSVVDGLNGQVRGVFNVSWYRVADYYFPLTETIELVAIMFATAGTVLLIRILCSVKTAAAPKNPLTGV